MRPGFGVAHGDQPARHGNGGIHSVGAFFHIWRSQQKGFVRLKILFASGIQAWKLKCPAALLLHVTRCSLFYLAYILILDKLCLPLLITCAY